MLSFAAAALLLAACAGDPASTATTSSTGSGGAGGTGATTSNTGGGSGTGGNGTGGGLPVACELTDGEAIPATCTGVYVSASAKDDSGDGSRGAPFQTLAAALKANAKTIYLCGDADNAVKGSATITKTVALQGGFGCDDWTYHADTKTKLLGDADKPALTVKGASTQVALNDLAIEAPNAVAEGASAIGVLADKASLTLKRVAITAGNGAAGVNGVKPTGNGAAGVSGKPGDKGCEDSAPNIGGPGAVFSCDGIVVNGGGGGNGTAALGGTGTSADVPGGTLPPDDGAGGLGQKAVEACKSGSTGPAGTEGLPGAGATGQGSLTATGYQPTSGDPGQSAGTPGYGGGGGGGAAVCSDNTKAGPGGGGGGSGGCGGTAGPGGGGGGSSIGIVSLGATLGFEEVTIQTKQGGVGGAGGEGQKGGSGGDPGLAGDRSGDGSASACGGGKGGQGGLGGTGGGGLGGHSVGVAFTGAEAPATTGADITAGSPGTGGAGKDAAGKGADGQGAATLGF